MEWRQPVDRLFASSSDHLFGTDGQGRDLYSRVVTGAQLSLIVGISVSITTSLIGGFLGLLSAPYRRTGDAGVDGLMAFPGIIPAIGIMAIRGADATTVIIALAVVSTPRMARVVRSVIIGLAHTQFVEAAESTGCSVWRVLEVHLLPNCLSPMLVQASFVFAQAVLGEATLSFLGAGAPPEFPAGAGCSPSRVLS